MHFYLISIEKSYHLKLVLIIQSLNSASGFLMRTLGFVVRSIGLSLNFLDDRRARFGFGLGLDLATAGHSH